MAANALGEWRAGWRTVLAAGLGMAAGVSLFATAFGFFVVPLQHAFGWSRSQLATVSLAFFTSSLTMPLVGVLLDRWGSRVFVVIGAVAFTAIYVAFALNPGKQWFFYALLVGIGLLAAPCTMPTVFARPIVNQFNISRGLALGIGLSGSYGMIVILSPVLQHVIGEYGWRLGFGLLAGMSLVLGLTASALLGNQAGGGKAASPPSPLPRGEGLALAVRDPRFWLLAVAMVISNIPVGGVISQLQPMLSDKGVPGTTAAMLGSVYAMAILVGRMGAGFLLDRFWPPLVGAGSLIAPAIGLLLFAGDSQSLPMFVVSLSLIGFAHGAEGDLASFFAARYFGVRAFGSIMGVFALLIGVSIALGGMIFAQAFDHLHSYAAALWVSAAAMGAAASMLLVSGLLKRTTAPAFEPQAEANPV